MTKGQTAVLLAAYNGERFLLPMLESLENQTDRDWICMIHDDGSSDGTVRLLNEWIENHGGEDGRYRLVQGPPAGGAAANFFFLLSMVEADFYLFADQDDVWLPEKIAKTRACLSALTEKPAAEETPAAVFTDMYVTDEALRVTAPSFIRSIGRSPHRTAYPQLLIDNPAAGCTMMFNRALRDLALQATDEKALSDIEMHDGWLLLLASIYGRVDCVDEPLAYYRQHQDNEMGAVRESRAQKILRNASDILTGRFAAEKKRFHQKEKTLAALLLRQPDLPDSVRPVLEELVELDAHGKLYRMHWYKEHGLSRAQNDFWMRLWV